MADLLFTIDIHSGGSFEGNPKLAYLGGRCDLDQLSYFEIQDMCVESGAPSTSTIYYLILEGNLEQDLRLITRDEKVLYMCEIHAAWPIDRITLYVESSEDQLQVVGNEGDVDDESVVGDEGVIGDEGVVDDENGELNELVCYDWMNDGLERLDFTCDIFGGNEGHNASHGEYAKTSRQHEVRVNKGNNSSHA